MKLTNRCLAIYLKPDFAIASSARIGLEVLLHQALARYSPALALETISLKRVRDETAMVYASAIAHPIAAKSKLPRPQITTEILESLHQSGTELDGSDPLAVWWQDWSFRATERGLLQGCLSLAAIAPWLDRVIQSPPRLAVPPLCPIGNLDPMMFQTLFTLQHTHARCCSWLQRLHRQGVIHLAGADGDPMQWHLPEAMDSPWQFGAVHPWLEHPSTFALVEALFDALDRLPDWGNAPQGNRLPSPEGVLPTALAVCETFDRFHRSDGCLRSPFSPGQRLLQIRLTLATQRVLYLLLEEVLGAIAPLQL